MEPLPSAESNRRKKKTRTLLVLAALTLSFAACTRSPSYYLDKGNRQFAQKQYDEAALNYRHAIQIAPQLGEAYYRVGLTDLRLSHARDAYQDLSRAVELLPDRDDAKVALGDLILTTFLANSARPKALYDRFALLSDQLLAKNPKSYDGLRFKGYLSLIDKKLADAEKFFQMANESKRMQPDVVLAWTSVLFLDNQPEQGEELAFKLIESDKTYGPIYDELFRQYSLLKRPGDAENILKAKARNNPRDARSLIQLATYYARTSREQEMQTVLKQMLDDPAAFPQAHLLVGDLYSRMHRWEAADQEYRQGAQANPKEKISYLKRIVDLWLAQGKGEQAAQVAGEILKEQPSDEAAKAVQASLLLASRKPEKVTEAASQFQALVTGNPENPVWRLNLGLALMAKGDAAGASRELREAIKRRSDFLRPRMALADLSQAQGDYNAALRYDDEILAIDPRQNTVRLQRAAILIDAGRYTEARNELMNLKTVFPNEVEFQSAALDLRQKNFKQAETRFRKLLELDHGNVRVLTGLVQTYLAQKQFETALVLLLEEVNRAPKPDQVRPLLADTALGLGRYDIALDQYERLLQGNPDSAPLHLRLAAAYRLKGDLSSAIDHLRKASALAPKDATSFALLGGALTLAGRKSEAMESLRHSLQLKPDNAAVMNDLAFLIVESGGRLDEALALAEKAVRMAPQQPNLTDTLGWIYFKRNSIDIALQIFRGLARKYPGNPEFRYHFGLALLQKGDRATAKAELKAALSSKPSAQLRQNIEAALVKIG
jgi:tetratricopeptide (TPR) repeat protein